MDCAILQRALGVRHDQLLIVLEHGAEAVALRAGAARAVEREELRRRRRCSRAVVGTLEALGEAKDGAARFLRDDRAVAVPFTERGRHGVGDAAALRVVRGESIDDDEQFFRPGEIDGAALEVLEVQRFPVGADAHEPLRAQVLHDDVMRHRVRQLERKRHGEACAGRQPHDRVGDGLHRIGMQLAAADPAVGATDPGPQQPQVVVYLRRRADGGPGRLGRILLLDRHRGREPFDGVDVRLFHALEELPGVRGERFDVASLAFGVDGVEREGGLPGTGGAGNDGKGATRDLDVEALEVVLTRAFDADHILHTEKFTPRAALPGTKCRAPRGPVAFTSPVQREARLPLQSSAACPAGASPRPVRGLQRAGRQRVVVVRLRVATL